VKYKDVYGKRISTIIPSEFFEDYPSCSIVNPSDNGVELIVHPDGKMEKKQK